MAEKIEVTRHYNDLSTGRGFQNVKFCPECGAKLTPTAKFCAECGERVK